MTQLRLTEHLLQEKINAVGQFLAKSITAEIKVDDQKLLLETVLLAMCECRKSPVINFNEITGLQNGAKVIAKDLKRLELDLKAIQAILQSLIAARDELERKVSELKGKLEEEGRVLQWTKQSS